MDTLSKTVGKLTMPLLVLLAISFSALPALGQYGGGSGTAGDPYLINTPGQMQAIGANQGDWYNHFRLMANINLSAYPGTSFNIIGNDVNSFTGVFDGNGHTISNFTYSSTGASYIGLFGYIELPAEIKDLGLIDPNVDVGTGDTVGSLVGHQQSGTITGCYVEGGSVSGTTNVGGLVGHNYYAMISDCYAGANVSGTTNVGGLVGRTESGIIRDCYSTGTVSSTGNNIGGLVGRNFGAISRCYSTGAVSGTTDVGGLVGWSREAKRAINCFWDTQTSGVLTSAGGSGKTTAEMKEPNTYIGWGSCSDWTIDGGVDYPHLVWENQPGESVPVATYGGGSGTESDPYQIYTAEQLNTIGLVACHWDAHFKLMTDIDLSAYTGTSFNIIGTYWNWDNYFTGAFDGNGHTISNFTYSSTGASYIGLFGHIDLPTEIKDLGLINPNVDAGTEDTVGSLVGYQQSGTITGCYVEGGSVSGYRKIGGLVGNNAGGTVTNCYFTGSVSGYEDVGGLVGYNWGTVTNCYSSANVSGTIQVGGLVGRGHLISNCYSVGFISGNTSVGGLLGYKEGGPITDSFWDVNTSGQTTSAGGIGLPTVQMQTLSTFVDAGWDFVSIWWIFEGVGYPRHLWEIPVLHGEPELTLGTINTISWEPVAGAIEYYIECAEDEDFTSIVSNSGWITETSCEFIDLQTGQRYWYRVKAINAAGVETGWSNVESSLQSTLGDAVDVLLDPASLKNENMKNALLNKIDEAMAMIDEGNYTGALSKLEHDILAKTNGCAETGEPDKNDWILACEQQSRVYGLVMETIEYVRSLIE